MTRSSGHSMARALTQSRLYRHMIHCGQSCQPLFLDGSDLVGSQSSIPGMREFPSQKGMDRHPAW